MSGKATRVNRKGKPQDDEDYEEEEAAAAPRTKASVAGAKRKRTAPRDEDEDEPEEQHSDTETASKKKKPKTVKKDETAAEKKMNALKTELAEKNAELKGAKDKAKQEEIKRVIAHIEQQIQWDSDPKIKLGAVVNMEDGTPRTPGMSILDIDLSKLTLCKPNGGKTGQAANILYSNLCYEGRNLGKDGLRIEFRGVVKSATVNHFQTTQVRIQPSTEEIEKFESLNARLYDLLLAIGRKENRIDAMDKIALPLFNRWLVMGNMVLPPEQDKKTAKWSNEKKNIPPNRLVTDDSGKTFRLDLYPASVKSTIDPFVTECGAIDEETGEFKIFNPLSKGEDGLEMLTPGNKAKAVVQFSYGYILQSGGFGFKTKYLALQRITRDALNAPASKAFMTFDTPSDTKRKKLMGTMTPSIHATESLQNQETQMTKISAAPPVMPNMISQAEIAQVRAEEKRQQLEMAAKGPPPPTPVISTSAPPPPAATPVVPTPAASAAKKS